MSDVPRGLKFDGGKPRWDLVPWEQMQAVVNVLTSGAKKYDDNNWKLVPEAQRRYFRAALGHIMKWRAGELADEETGESHLAHAACCLLFLMWFDAQPVPFVPTDVGTLVHEDVVRGGKRCTELLEANRTMSRGKK
jgi:hypothetical protein